MIRGKGDHVYKEWWESLTEEERQYISEQKCKETKEAFQSLRLMAGFMARYIMKEMDGDLL